MIIKLIFFYFNSLFLMGESTDYNVYFDTYRKNKINLLREEIKIIEETNKNFLELSNLYKKSIFFKEQEHRNKFINLRFNMTVELFEKHCDFIYKTIHMNSTF